MTNGMGWSLKSCCCPGDCWDCCALVTVEDIASTNRACICSSEQDEYHLITSGDLFLTM
uniref:Uncharacterized protein n=1 Tax=Arundo donax TaxID=35708 RepID=A0A0A9GWE7_ARUDO